MIAGVQGSEVGGHTEDSSKGVIRVRQRCRGGSGQVLITSRSRRSDPHQEAAGRSKASDRPLSLYTHLPFCAHLCYYCACNKVITKKRDKAMPYVERVLKEAAIQSRLFGTDRPVKQLHWGGGTPTFDQAVSGNLCCMLILRPLMTGLWLGFCVWSCALSAGLPGFWLRGRKIL